MLPDAPGDRDPDLASTRTTRDAVNAALFAWYDRTARDLAFRRTPDPWHVLVSEVMLQQTQAVRVDAAWPAFVARFPTPAAMAEASPAEVLRAWSGLGYNRRAIWLHAAARTIVERHGGRVPPSIDALDALPGIGSYTARAVAAIAFRQPVAGLDTNVRRVIGRVVGVERPVDPGDLQDLGDERVPRRPGGATARGLQRAADALVDPERPDRWTHAVMDLGATVCRPRRPRCHACPVRTLCVTAASVTAGDAAPVRTFRAAPQAARGPASTVVPFQRTDRWLRGRIIDRLRQAPPHAWVSVDGPIGDHAAERVAAAILALERDRLLERSPDGRVRLPSTSS